MTTRMMLIHCLSPLHVGTGQGVGAVDLPITREVSTGLPYLPGSSIKGSLRDRSRQKSGRDQGQKDSKETIALFGPETENASEHAGALIFGDANLLCLPVRSVYGTFAWVSSPLLLQRFFRDVRETTKLLLKIDRSQLSVDRMDRLRATEESSISNSSSRAYVEDLDFYVDTCPVTSQLARQLGQWLYDDSFDQSLFRRRFVIVHDDVLTFLSKHAIDVRTRASLDPDTKTVKDKMLWTEENLPAESILISLVSENAPLVQKHKLDVFKELSAMCEGSVQFGGQATVGRGRCRIVLQGG